MCELWLNKVREKFTKDSIKERRRWAWTPSLSPSIWLWMTSRDHSMLDRTLNGGKTLGQESFDRKINAWNMRSEKANLLYESFVRLYCLPTTSNGGATLLHHSFIQWRWGVKRLPSQLTHPISHRGLTSYLGLAFGTDKSRFLLTFFAPFWFICLSFSLQLVRIWTSLTLLMIISLLSSILLVFRCFNG